MGTMYSYVLGMVPDTQFNFSPRPVLQIIETVWGHLTQTLVGGPDLLGGEVEVLQSLANLHREREIGLIILINSAKIVFHRSKW
jgi:hypothetical protein